jgi:hypothetical protein
MIVTSTNQGWYRFVQWDINELMFSVQSSSGLVDEKGKNIDRWVQPTYNKVKYVAPGNYKYECREKEYGSRGCEPRINNNA